MSGVTAVQLFSLATERLVIKPANFEDLTDYEKINSDEEICQWVLDGKTVSAEQTAKRIKLWVEIWGVPFTGYAVRLKNLTFVGSIHLTSADSPGIAELSYMFVKTQQRNGYCSEAATAFMYEYVPTLVQRECPLNGMPLKKIVATARTDNIPSKRILEMLGMSYTHEAEKYGKMRLHFTLDLNGTDYQIRCLVFGVLKSAKLISLIANYAR